MKSASKRECRIVSAEQLDRDVFSIWIEDCKTDSVIRPGQFLSLFCTNGARLLPRPISICEVDTKLNRIRLVYRVVGEGTKEFSKLQVGDTIEIMGPLGNGFSLEESKNYSKPILIGGGIGIPPMLELSKQLHTKSQVILGYRNSTFLDEDFQPYGMVYLATEDGSKGTKGNVIDALKENGVTGDVIYACGPTNMLKGVKAYAEEHGIKAYLSLEEKMACGIGACYACVCKSAKTDEHTHVANKRVCKEGPVLSAEDIIL